ncbi:ATP-binding protein [Streptomyces sp. NPDC049627]|uniref:ATP-binding protein n=1 Tax=Streptomyces sp. NPDC049627 TaxID=3365595 RepID=UPI0037A2C4DE
MTIPATNTSDADMAQPSQAELVCALPHISEAVSVVRRQARTVLTRWRVPTPTADDALLVISELTTNAIVHALPPAVLRLSLPEVGGRRAVRIEITDSGPAPRRCPSHDSPHPAEQGERSWKPASSRPSPHDACPAPSPQPATSTVNDSSRRR